MDGERFDEMARQAASATSRRSVIRVAAGGVLGLVWARETKRAAAAACLPPGARKCAKPQQCCSGRCNKKKKKCLPCPTGTEYCAATQSCEQAGSGCCPAGLRSCGGTCADIASDEANCGDCGAQCEAGQTCCGGKCRDTATDPNHCGACGATCDQGKTCCGGACRDTASDERHCGGCGIACRASEACIDGQCLACDVCPQGCPSTTIQEAINAADPGAVIHVCPGTYSENVTIRKDVAIVGAGSDPDGVVLIPVGFHAITLFVDQGATARLEQLAISGEGAVDPAAVGVYNLGDLTLTHCLVEQFAPQGYGGGIFNGSSGALTLRQSTVSRNAVSHSAGKGGGIYNARAGTVTLVDSSVSDNTVGDSGGGLFNEPDGVASLTNSTISANVAGIQGGGIANQGDLTLNDSLVRGNRASQGGGLYNSGTVHLKGTSRVANNTPDNCVGTTACGS